MKAVQRVQTFAGLGGFLDRQCGLFSEPLDDRVVLNIHRLSLRLLSPLPQRRTSCPVVLGWGFLDSRGREGRWRLP
jgi:hypothetical protein